jgi:type IV secretory pathway component VirB8
MPTCTLADYYKGFVSLSGAITAILTAVPIAGELTGGAVSATLFPPIGSAYRLPTLLVIVALTIAIYETRTAPWIQSARKRRRALWMAFGIAFLGVLVYVASYSRFVVELPVKDQQAFVAVGFERQSFSNEHLKEGSDSDLLRYRGLTDEDIKTIWTLRSIVVARVTLLTTYLLVLLPLIAGCSLIVLFDVIGSAASP